MYILRIVVYIIAVIVASICAIGCEDEYVNDGQNVIDDSDVLKGVYTSVILGLEQTIIIPTLGNRCFNVRDKLRPASLGASISKTATSGGKSSIENATPLLKSATPVTFMSSIEDSVSSTPCRKRT